MFPICCRAALARSRLDRQGFLQVSISQELPDCRTASNRPGATARRNRSSGQARGRRAHRAWRERRGAWIPADEFCGFQSAAGLASGKARRDKTRTRDTLIRRLDRDGLSLRGIAGEIERRGFTRISHVMVRKVLRRAWHVLPYCVRVFGHVSAIAAAVTARVLTERLTVEGNNLVSTQIPVSHSRIESRNYALRSSSFYKAPARLRADAQHWSEYSNGEAEPRCERPDLHSRIAQREDLALKICPCCGLDLGPRCLHPEHNDSMAFGLQCPGCGETERPLPAESPPHYFEFQRQLTAARDRLRE